MNKKLIVLMSVIIMIVLNSVSYATVMKLNYDGTAHNYLGPVLTLKVNGETLKTDIPPIILNDRSLVPVRSVFEKLGAKVSWDQAAGKLLFPTKQTSGALY